MSEDKKPERKRPLDPTTGAVVLLGSLAVTGAITWGLSRLYPFGTEALEGLRFPLTSEGAWLIIGAWMFFPVVYAAAFLRLAKGVDLMRLAFAYSGVTYFFQSWAEFVARDNVSLWPELLFTAIPTLIFLSLAKKHAPKEEDESDSAS